MLHPVMRSWILRAAIIFMTAMDTAVAQSGNDYWVTDLVTQFSQINSHGEPLGARRGVGVDGVRLCKHYQSVVRLPGAGRPYFYFLRSGNATGTCEDQGDDPGELLVVRMDSRDTDGERLRSNKLQSGSRFDDTPPSALDRGIKSILLDGGSIDTNGTIWPGWCHPGGSQIVDDVLVVPVEHRFLPNDDADGGFLLIDVSTPNDPTLIKEFDLNEKIGVMAATRDPISGKYLFLLTGGSFNGASKVRFIMSTTTDLRDPAVALAARGESPLTPMV